MLKTEKELAELKLRQEIYRSINGDDIEREVTDFKKFAFNQSMVAMSVAVILGGAFNKAVTAISEGLFMPLINAVLSSASGNWKEIQWEPIPHMVFNIGMTLSAGLDFMLTALVLYIVYIKGYEWLVHKIEGDKPTEQPVPIFIDDHECT